MSTSVHKKTLTIIGCGKVGKALGRCLSANADMQILDVLNRSAASTLEAISFLGAGRAASGFDDLAPADFYMIAAGDTQIESACEALAHSGRLATGSVVFHCSGALASSALRSARDAGTAVASVHPIRSFAAPEKVAGEFGGTYCGIEGDVVALEALSPLFKMIGAMLVPIATGEKQIYHAAAVFASNYLVTLLDVAGQAYRQAGIPPELALQLLGPLVRNTVDNVLHLGPAQALTGPIARGDLDAAQAQLLAVLKWDERFGELYRQFARLTAELAGQPHRMFMTDEEKKRDYRFGE
ncbi:MAG TPA: Rossmann-like and DUF2520 domain-containing protein [Noviherbaspirillum sp.]|jgi:predicted short-subunit dehydrogenase-like oxidoreductase (DUF2520 family)|uniref:Rossmann-like and DUF2520 domain-containing protein n=1 Tax=Noviherbaspirillum sp. TaxID=1926288 RepID=UPI002DDCC4DC|nr:Rossmann-like and DUF2520 domain-containing protein [Noviherbaspirillum sp.]HEV2608835.1 Rossmann-like and DUF2520 domain-containing protein [Noviherbaspirillum sp.]